MKNLNITKSQKLTKEIFELSFDSFLQFVENPKHKLLSTDENEIKTYKESVPYVYGCDFSESRILKEYVTEYNYIFADFDNANMKNHISFYEMYNINFILYTSINHKIKNQDKDRFRVVFPLDGVITKEQWEILSRKINGSSAFTTSPIFAEVDQSSFSSNRGFCFPVLTQNYFSKISLGGMNLSFNTFESAYNKSKKEIVKQEKNTKILIDLQKMEADPIKKKIFRDNLLSDLRSLDIDWSKDGINGKKGISTNNLIAKTIGKLLTRGFDSSEISDFRRELSTNFSYQHLKEWEYCLNNFSKRK